VSRIVGEHPFPSHAASKLTEYLPSARIDTVTQF
jgi:hypothetical protein